MSTVVVAVSVVVVFSVVVVVCLCRCIFVSSKLVVSADVEVVSAGVVVVVGLWSCRSFGCSRRSFSRSCSCMRCRSCSFNRCCSCRAVLSTCMVTAVVLEVIVFVVILKSFVHSMFVLLLLLFRESFLYLLTCFPESHDTLRRYRRLQDGGSADILNLVKTEIAPFDPPTPKTPLQNQARSESKYPFRTCHHLNFPRWRPYILDLVKAEIAALDPPISKTLPQNQT